MQLHIKSVSSEKNVQSACRSQSLSLSVFWLLHNFHFLTITQIMGHPWATTTALEIWLGDVPKGEVNLFFSSFRWLTDWSINFKHVSLSGRGLKEGNVFQGEKKYLLFFYLFSPVCMLQWCFLLLKPNHTNDLEKCKSYIACFCTIFF